MVSVLGMNTQGAVVYQAIEPVDVYKRDIDLDGDGEPDFFTSTSPNLASIIPVGNNRVLAVSALPPNLGRWIEPLMGGEIIGETTDFSRIWSGLDDRVNQFDNGGSAIYFCNARGPIGVPPDCTSVIPDGNEIRFVGLEFESGGNTKYGYVAISVDVLTPIHLVKVNGWAYETEPNKAIFAGTIPEPSTVLFSLLGVVLALHRRR